MTRRSLPLADLWVAAAGVWAAAGIMSLLPPSGTISGWSIVPGADNKGCTAADFYSMYDGAAPDMLQAGVASAGQRVYQRGSKRLTVDILRFKTVGEAQAYYSARQAEIAGQQAFWTCSGANRSVARCLSGRTYVSYQWTGQYYCTMSVNGTSAAEKTTLWAFTSYISNRVAAQH
jgi:hypothetical protein